MVFPTEESAEMKPCSHDAVPLRPAVLTLAAAVGVVCITIALGVCGAGGCGGPATPTASPMATAASPSTTSESPPPSSPAASPSAQTKQLVVAAASGARGNGLSVISSTGRLKQLLAPSGGPLRSLAWSPDGRRLAYLKARSTEDYAARLFCYDAATGKSSQIVFPNEDTEAVIDSFAWVAPTELIAAVIGSGPTYRANGALWLCDIMKGTKKVVKDAGGHVVKGAGVSSSADGARIAFVSYGPTSGGEVAERLRMLNADNLVVSTVATGRYATDIDGDAFAYPRISPDGSAIYTVQAGNDPGFGCSVWNVDGSKAMRATGLIWPAPASWSSSGRLAFGAAGAQDAWMADSIQVWQPGTAKPTAILSPRTKLPITSLAWSPEATQIAYTVSKEDSYDGSLWVVNADGTNRHLLAGSGSWPAWAMAPISFP
jgi:WD40 repeat protein